MSSDSPIDDSPAVDSVPRRTWREWWRQLPGYCRIGVRALVVAVLVQAALAGRVYLGLYESKEIVAFRREGVDIIYHADLMGFHSGTPHQVTHFTAKFIKGLRGCSCSAVEWISFDNTNVSAEELRYVRRYFPNATGILLDGCEITDEGIEVLAGCSSLELLCLSDTEIDDDDVARLASIKSLEWLDLTGTAVSDVSLPILQSMPQLTLVNLRGTQITSAGMENCGDKGVPEQLTVRTDFDQARDSIRGLICWSDGRLASRYLRDFSLVIQPPTADDDTGAEVIRGWHLWHDGYDGLLFNPEKHFTSDGDYRLTLTLGSFTSESVTLTMRNGKPIGQSRRIEFRMPVTEAEALK